MFRRWSQGWPQNPIYVEGLEPWIAPNLLIVRFGATDGPETLQIHRVWSHGWPPNPINQKGVERWIAAEPYKFIKFGARDVSGPRAGLPGLVVGRLNRKPIPNEPNTGPKQPGPSARPIWDLVLVRSYWAYKRNRSKTYPGRPARRPETLLRQQSVRYDHGSGLSMDGPNPL